MLLPKRNTGIKSLFSIMSTMLSWSLMSLLFVMFYCACLDPSNQLIIDVNAYGEMRIEAVVFGLVWIMTTIHMIDDLGNTFRY